MHKLFYLLLSTFLCFVMITTLFDFTIQASNSLIFNGATEGVIKHDKNSTHPELFYLSDYPHGCSGVWSCATLMQKLFIKHKNQTYIVAVRLNPFDNNITEQIYEDPHYYITFYSIIFSIISISFSIIIGFIFSIKYLTNSNKIELSINLDEDIHKDNSWTRTKKIWYIVLFTLRIPVYVSVILIYTYMMPSLFIDNVPFIMKLNEYIRVFSLLVVYIIDNFVFPYGMLN